MHVSICIPTYNQAKYIEQAICSCIKQSYPPLEIIVSNDCSTDETQTILDRLSIENPKIKCVQQPRNLGIVKNTDACLRLAQGDFVVRLDSDDYLDPNYTQVLLDMLLQYPEAGYAHAGVQEVDSSGNFLRQRRLYRKTGFQSSDNALLVAPKGYKVAANIVMFRKEALMKVNYLAGRPNFGEDYHLTASISAAGFGNIYSDEILSFYRVWVDEAKLRKKRKQEEISGLRQVYEEVLEPAYKAHGWSLSKLKDSRTRLACSHANCLAWDVYDQIEKMQLDMELYRLSASTKARLYSWLYRNGYGNILDIFSKVNSSIKAGAKKAYLYFRN